MGMGPVLLAARRRMRMSQEHLASVSGVSVRTIRRAETGEEVSGESLRCLCAVLEIQADAPHQAMAPAVERSIAADVERLVPEPELTDVENAVCRVLAFAPSLPLAVAALLLVTGVWAAEGLPLLFIALNALVALLAPVLARRHGVPATTILLGLGYVYASVLWLINFGAGSPLPLQVALAIQLPAGMAMMALGIRAHHRRGSGLVVEGFDGDAGNAQGRAA